MPWGGLSGRSLFDAWLEAARAWTELARGAPFAPALDGGLLLELASTVAGAFGGRRITARIAGRTVHADLHSVAVARHPGGHDGRLDLRRVEVDGMPVDEVTAVADEVSLAAQPDTRLLLSGLEIRGTMRLEPLLARLADHVPGWTLMASRDGVIEARRQGRRHGLLLDAAVRTGVLTVDVRAIRLGRMTVRGPRWIHYTRRIRLPAQPDGVSVAEAICREEHVEFRLAVPALTQPFDLGRLSRAVAVAGRGRAA